MLFLSAEESSPSSVNGYSLLEYAEHALGTLQHKHLDYDIELQYLKRVMAATQKDIEVQKKLIAELREKAN